jgi:hypothetical protein
MISKPTAIRSAALCFVSSVMALSFSSCKDDKDGRRDSRGGAPVARRGPVPTDLKWLKEMAPGGAMVYTADKVVRVVELDGKITKLGDGFMPEFSPDGSKVAWVRGGGFWVSDRAGKAPRMLHDKVYKVTGAHWLDNESIAAVMENGKKRNWYRFELNGLRTPMPELDQLGIGLDKLGRETDVRQAKDGIWTYVAYQSWKTSDGKGGPIGGGCACSISPDGKSITALQGGHKSLVVHPVRRGGVKEHELFWLYDGSFDNHRWSSNDERFLVGVEETKKRMVVIEWKTGRAVAFGKTGHKDNRKMYGDFTKADGKAGKPFPPLLPPNQRELAGAAPTAKGEPMVLNAWPFRTEGMVYLFENSRESNEFRELSTDAPRAVPGQLVGHATINRFYGLDLRGGSYAVSGVGEALISRVNAGQAFAVEFTAKSDSSESGDVVKFGSNFSVPGSIVKEGGYRHVVVSVSGGKTAAYVDGVPAKVPAIATGSWKPGELSFGWGWDGDLEGVALFSRAIDATEAKQRFAGFSKRLSVRKPAPRLVVEAELVTYTPPRPLDRMDTYRRCLSEHLFKVSKVVSGDLEAETIRVLDWGTLDMKMLPQELKGKEGGRYRLTLERKEDNPQLKKELTELSDDLDSPEFFLIGREKG